MTTLSGKTKWIEPLFGKPGFGRVYSRDDLTAGDGAKHDILPGKAVLANATTCHVFDMLQSQGVPLAYVRRDGDQFITKIVEMIPVEVVVRNEAAGSYCKRNPTIPAGTVFSKPVVEYYYKTSGRRFRDVSIECDDPLMIFTDGGKMLELRHPARPVDLLTPPMLTVGDELMSFNEIQKLYRQLQRCTELALDVNLYLAQAWELNGGQLIDFKIECGVDDEGKVLVADVIDCDSWRVTYAGQQLSKQPYRDGDDLTKVLRVYQLAERITRSFWN
jgi:phosphoribosylaminoimidazole-succinocarboxamide synthase